MRIQDHSLRRLPQSRLRSRAESTDRLALRKHVYLLPHDAKLKIWKAGSISTINRQICATLYATYSLCTWWYDARRVYRTCIHDGADVPNRARGERHLAAGRCRMHDVLRICVTSGRRKRAACAGKCAACTALITEEISGWIAKLSSSNLHHV